MWDFRFWVVMRTSSNKINKNIYFLSDERFGDLTRLFIDQIYPHTNKLDDSNNSSFLLNALAYNESCIISSPLSSNLNTLKQRINADIKILEKVKYPSIFLIYLVNSALFPNRKDIQKHSASLSQNGYRVILYDDFSMDEILIRSQKHPPFQKYFDLKPRYETLYRVPDVEQNVIEEIFSFIHSAQKNNVKIPPFEKKYLKLKSKIDVNFNDKLYTDVKILFHSNWSNKVIVEDFIKRNFHHYESQLFTILGLVRNHFKKVNENFKGITDFPVNDPAYFEMLAQSILPPDKKVEPRYLSAATAIILFLFEYCDFGRKTVDDPLSLFE